MVISISKKKLLLKLTRLVGEQHENVILVGWYPIVNSMIEGTVNIQVVHLVVNSFRHLFSFFDASLLFFFVFFPFLHGNKWQNEGWLKTFAHFYVIKVSPARHQFISSADYICILTIYLHTLVVKRGQAQVISAVTEWRSCHFFSPFKHQCSFTGILGNN